MLEAPSFAAEEGEILRRVAPSGKQSLPDRRCCEDAEDSPEKRKIARWEEKRNEDEAVEQKSRIAFTGSV
jgi:hypothetical protein